MFNLNAISNSISHISHNNVSWTCENFLILNKIKLLFTHLFQMQVSECKNFSNKLLILYFTWCTWDCIMYKICYFVSWLLFIILKRRELLFSFDQSIFLFLICMMWWLEYVAFAQEAWVQFLVQEPNFYHSMK